MLGSGPAARRFTLIRFFTLRSCADGEKSGARVVTSSVIGAAEARLRRSSKLANTTVQSRVCILTIGFFWRKTFVEKQHDNVNKQKSVLYKL